MTIEQIQKVVDTFFELCAAIGIQLPEQQPLIMYIKDDAALGLNDRIVRQFLTVEEVFREEQATFRYANLLHALRYWDRSQYVQAVRFVMETTGVGLPAAVDFVDTAWKNNL